MASTKRKKKAKTLRATIKKKIRKDIIIGPRSQRLIVVAAT